MTTIVQSQRQFCACTGGKALLPKGKHLVYTCLGGDPSYLKVFAYLIHSLLLHPYSSQHRFDFLVISDKILYSYVQDYISKLSKPSSLSIYVHLANTNHRVYEENNMTPSYIKLHLFDWPQVFDYSSALFIDADIIIPPHFDFCHFVENQACCLEKLEDGCLYAMSEFQDKNMHRIHYFDLHDYTDDEIDAFERDGVYAFNAGLFSFKINDKSMQMLNDIRDMIHKTPDPKLFFYEQSFMNVYLNRKRKARYNLITHDHCALFVRPESEFEAKLLHFCGEASDGVTKDEFMLAFCKRHWHELIEHISNIQKR